MSVPLSPRNVTFADQVRRPGSALPPGARAQLTTTLDQAAEEMLLLSSGSQTLPSASKFSGSTLQPTADEQLKKAVSTSSIQNIRTPDGGVLKLSNVYTWNAGGTSQQNLNTDDSMSPGGQSGYEQSTTGSMLTSIQVTEKHSGAPLVKTTVTGHLDQAQVVGAELVEVAQSLTDQWEIKDVTTQYKIRTTFPGRTIVFEDVENTTTDDLTGISVIVSGEKARIASRADESTRIVTSTQDTNVSFALYFVAIKAVAFFSDEERISDASESHVDGRRGGVSKRRIGRIGRIVRPPCASDGGSGSLSSCARDSGQGGSAA